MFYEKESAKEHFMLYPIREVNMKLISWNVNGLRAVMGKNFMEVFTSLDADFFCLQETKLQAGQIDLELPGYFQYWNYAEKKGSSRIFVE